jgi:hypothetical protein
VVYITDMRINEAVPSLQDFMAQREQRELSRELWRNVGGHDPLADDRFDVAAVVAAGHDYPGEDTFDRIAERNMA